MKSSGVFAILLAAVLVGMLFGSNLVRPATGPVAPRPVALAGIER